MWQWVRREIQLEVESAGFDDLNPAHVGLFRYPSLDGKRPTELAEELQITKQSVNDLLGHLERHGCLVRDPDPSDSRSRRIRLTPRGREVEDVTWRAAEEAERKVAELVGSERLAELRSTLLDLVRILDLTPERPATA